MEQKKTEKAPEVRKPEDFVKKYTKLCEEYGYQIVVTPTFRVSQDTGDWRIVLQSSVGKLPKQE